MQLGTMPLVLQVLYKMVAGELAQSFELMADGILTFVNYGITIVVIMIIIEIINFFKGGKLAGKLKEPFSRVGEAYSEGGLGGVAKQTGRDIRKVFAGEKRAEKFVLREFVDLTKLRKEVKDVKAPEDINNLRSEERRAERDESRAYRRINQLENRLKRARLPPEQKAEAEAIVKQINVFNKEVVGELKKFGDRLNLGGDVVVMKKSLLKILDDAIEAEQDLVAEFRKIEKMLK